MINTMSPNSIVVLLVENSPDDAALIKEMIAELQTNALQPTSILLNHVKTLREARDYLSGAYRCDVVLFDLTLPDSEGLDTIGQMSPYAAAFPAIVLTGLSDDALAVEALKRGSQDYLLKSEINPVLLSRAIYYAVERFKILKERENFITELKKTLSEIKTLSDLIPICMHCKQIRNDKGYWEQLDMYISSHSHVKFSHGICPECAKTIYGLDEDDQNGCSTNSVIPIKTPASACGHPSIKGA